MSVSIDARTEILKFIDPHLALRMMDFSLDKLALDSGEGRDSLLTMKKKLLFKTSLASERKKFAEDNKFLFQPEEYDLIFQSGESENKKEDQCKNSIIGFLNLMDNCRKNNNFDMGSSISKKIVDETSVNKVLEYSKILYDSGRYSEAKTILSDFCKVSVGNRKNLSRVILAFWTILSINIIEENWEEILTTFSSIKTAIEYLRVSLEEDMKKLNAETSDKIQFDFKHVLLFKSYLIHLSLFLIKDNKGLEKFLNSAFEESSFSLIESSFNHIFRYLIVIAIISKSKDKINTLKNTFSVLGYEDEFIRLFNAIFVNFDIESSCDLTNQCVKMMDSDYFLSGYVNIFAGKCKETLLENHIMLNSSIDIKFFADNFREKVESTEKYVVDFLNRNYKCDISSNENTIIYRIKNADNENIHMLKARELYDVTKNMIEIVRMHKSHK